jgi:hypothetical protein
MLCRRPGLNIARYTLICGVAFVLSFGPFFTLTSQSPPVPLPYLYLLEFVPGFSAMRAPARFDFLLMLGLSVLAGFGVARLQTASLRLRNQHPARALLATLGIFTVLEVVSLPTPTTRIEVGSAVPPVYTWLRSQDPSASVGEVPARGPSGFASLKYEYFSIYHWHPLVTEGTGFDPPASSQVLDTLDAFPSPTSVEDLRALGVRFVVAHFDRLDASKRQQLDDADPTQLELGIAATFGSDVVYQISAPAASPSLADHVNIELPTVIGRGLTPSITASITNDTGHPLTIGVPQAAWAQIEWNSEGASRSARQDLPVFLEPGHEVRLAFPAPPGSTIGSSDSAQLTVRIAGSVDLQASQTVRFLDLPTSLDPKSLGGNLERVQVQTPVRANDQMEILVTARNTSKAVWLPELATNPEAPGRVGVSVKNWIGPDGTALPPIGNTSSHSSWNVAPGQAVSFTLATTAPKAPGRYRVVLDMLSENIAWFSDVNGGAQTVIPVQVDP